MARKIHNKGSNGLIKHQPGHVITIATAYRNREITRVIWNTYVPHPAQ